MQVYMCVCVQYIRNLNVYKQITINNDTCPNTMTQFPHRSYTYTRISFLTQLLLPTKLLILHKIEYIIYILN